MGKRILVIDPDEDSRSSITQELLEAGHDVVALSCGQEALAEVEADRPAAVLTEVLLPDMSGMELLRRIREGTSRHLAVMLVTSRAAEIDRVIGFELGADDYVVKPVSLRELVLRVAAVLRRSGGSNGRSIERLAAGAMKIDIARHEVTVGGEPVPLTALEFRLLVDLMQHRGRVQRREDLLQRVWDQRAGELDTRTVDTHVKRIREKLGDAADMLETVRGVGYRFRK